jgi:hypothetical protein
MGKKARLVTAAGAMLVAVAALGSVQPANAYLPNECMLGIGVAVCGPMAINRDTRIIRHNDDVDDSSDAIVRRREWQARCKPHIVQDLKTGIRHHKYAAKGCEFGP